ncbi:hypothetical protein [Nocardioides panaciterrulae]|uniref:Uncharacterized protein n=1 Tax=Nocardioides panaciterrulae TaxID=661492 RepID=A0A7Y9E9U8_9ACTN|nr:hypothetical protein [Nocardioides panaciterrulae]NYD43647.1 hypothetical protein [Nocardioides panaciterrulae]
MAEEDRGSEGPSLELPKWSLPRRRARRKDDRSPEPGTPAAASVRPPEPRSPAEATPAPGLAATSAPTRVAPTPVESAPLAEKPAAAPRRAMRPRRRLGGMPAAVLTGVVVGLVTVGLTWAAQRGCEAVRGTSSCGGGPGFLLLLAITVAMVFLGAALLRLSSVPDPGSTSFLAVGLLAVVTLLFFIGVIFTWWMTIIVPVCAAGTYALAHWVTSTFAEPDR